MNKNGSVIVVYPLPVAGIDRTLTIMSARLIAMVVCSAAAIGGVQRPMLDDAAARRIALVSTASNTPRRIAPFAARLMAPTYDR